MPAVPLTGWAPDADPTTPGILRGGNFVPTKRGIVAPTGATPMVGTYPGTGATSTAMLLTNPGQRFLAGQSDNVFEFRGGAWSTLGFNFTLGTAGRISFAAFGDLALASNIGTPIQQSNGFNVGFTPLSATAPRAEHIVTTANFVVAFSTVDGTYGTSPDRWWCSPINNPAGDWTPSITTQANTGRLIGNGGRITAALPLGEQIVAYKESSIFVGSYVGSPEVWRWQQIPGVVGALGPDAVCDIGGAHFIIGADNVWLFDGTRPVPIGSGVARDAMFAEAALQPTLPALRLPSVVFDAIARRAHFKLQAGMLSAFVYDVETRRFGRYSIDANRSFCAAAVPANAGATPLLRVGTRASSGPPNVGQGASSTSLTFLTHTFGTDARVSMAREFRAICTGAIGGARTITGSAGNSQQTIAPSGSGSSSSTGDVVKFDLRQTGRWHSFDVSLASPGATEVMAVDVDLIAGGPR